MVTRGQLSADEEAAGKIVAQLLGGTHEARDVRGAPDGTHDLDILLADGSRVPLEVTSSRDPEAVEALRRLLFDRNWEAPTLSRHWSLGVPNDKGVRVKPLMTSVVAHLEVLEQHDVEQVSDSRRGGEVPASASPEVTQAARAIFDLGADRATRLDPPKPGETPLVMASLHGGVSASPELLNRAVEACADKKAAKLRAAEGNEKHLFVWLSASGVELALATLPMPDSQPTLPEGIDVVWVATRSPSDAPAGRLWRVRPPGRWEEIGASFGR